VAENNVFMSLKADPSGMLNALALVYEALEKNTNAVKKQKTEAEKAADAAKKMTTDAEKAWKNLATNEEKAADKLKQYKEYLEKGIWTQDRYTEAVKRTQKATQDWQSTIGGSLFGEITRAGIALQAIQQVQQSITNLVQEEMAARQGGGDKLIALAKKRASLAQYEDAGKLEGMARELIRTGAMAPGQAFDTVEKMKAVDLTDQFAQVKSLGASMLFGENFDEYLGAVGSMRTGFKGRVGNVMDITSMALGAGYGAPAKASEVLGYAAKASGVMSAAGFSPEQSLAMADVASRTIGRETGSALESFARAVARNPQLAGKTPQQIIDYVKQNNITGEAFFKMFPDNAARVMTQFQANAADLAESETRVRDYQRRGEGQAAVERAYGRNADVSAAMQTIGAEEDYRTFEQGPAAAARGQILRQGRRAVASGFINSVVAPFRPTYDAIRSAENLTGANILPSSGQILEALNAINNGTQETNQLLRAQKEAAPQSQPKTEQ
jgi:hypothetical protein